MSFLSQKSLLFFGIVLQSLMIIGCNDLSTHETNIVLYTSVVDEALIDFYQDLHDPYALYPCDKNLKSRVRVEVYINTPTPVSDLEVHYLKGINPISPIATVWAYNSLDAANSLGTNVGLKKIFLNDITMVKSMSESLCDGSIHENQIVVFYNYSSDNLMKPLEESGTPSVPKFDASQMDILAAETFYKLAEAQNLLANEQNVNIADEIISNTLRIFYSAQNTVQIKNLHQQSTIELPVKDYLHRLYNLKQYDSVNVTWNDDLKILKTWEIDNTEIPKSTNYMSGRQKFTGYKKNIALYTDTVDKTIELHAKLVENIDITGNVVLEWKVFLGDINISSDSSFTPLLQT